MTPNRRRIEGVYDRFLMATSGVKSVRRGNQSGTTRHTRNAPQGSLPPRPNHNSNHHVFTIIQSAPPPVPSGDLKLPTTVDEFEPRTSKLPTDVSHSKDDSNNTVAIVRRALKAVVTGKK